MNVGVHAITIFRHEAAGDHQSTHVGHVSAQPIEGLSSGEQFDCCSKRGPAPVLSTRHRGDAEPRRNGNAARARQIGQHLGRKDVGLLASPFDPVAQRCRLGDARLDDASVHLNGIVIVGRIAQSGLELDGFKGHDALGHW